MTNHICGAICGAALEETHRRPDGTRWCFVCRARRQFDVVVSMPVLDRDVPLEDQTGAYYGPSSQIECTSCGTTDGDCFPGTWRDWSDQ